MASKSISKSVVWQLGGKIALQGIAFFSTPIFTRLLNPLDYGFTALYGTWLSIFSLVVGFCVGTTIGNAWIKYGEEKLSEYLSAVMSIGILSYFSILTIVVLFKRFFVNLIGFSFPIIVLLVTHSFFSFVITFEIGRLDQLKKVEKSTIVSTILSVCVILTSLLLVFLSKESKWQAKIIGQAIPTCLFGFVILFVIYLRGKRVWNNEYARFCLKLCLPLILHAAGHMIFNQTDRIMLQKMYDESTLGIYSITFNLCNIITIIYGAFNVAWVPFYYEYKKKKENDEVIKHSKKYIKLVTLICVGFVLLSYDVFKVMAPESYWSGMSIIPLFVLSTYFGYAYLFPVNFEFFHAKTKLIPVATFLAAGVNILINFLLIPTYGMQGAAIGTLVAHILLFLFHVIVAKVVIKEEFEYKLTFFLPGICITVFFCIITPLLKNMFILRWIIAGIIGIYIIIDIYRTRRIF